MGQQQLHVFFLPLMAHGHTIPLLDMAKLFTSRGVKTTIITTPINAANIAKSIQTSNNSGSEIALKTIKFRPAEAGLPENCETVDQIPSHDMMPNFFKATANLQEPFELLVQESRPNCIVSDSIFPWTTKVAAKFGIPRIVFNGISSFSVCAISSMRLHKPHLRVSSNDEPFIVPYLPHEIKLTKNQFSHGLKEEKESGFVSFWKEMMEAEEKSYGVVVNSFYEVEPEYADHYMKVSGKKVWEIGPVSLCNRKKEEKGSRGKESSIGEDECLKWLDSKQPDSVIYVCFGSLAKLTNAQLFELAMGLEASGQNFIWVVRRENNDGGGGSGGEEKWLPEGFEERNREKGLIIRGWAPQVLILDHQAIGGFVTHCGWNSTLEGVAAGVPLVTWPAFAEQFWNEKLVTDVLRIGVGVGAEKWDMTVDGIKREKIAEAIEKIMVGDEAAEMRKRAKELKIKAMKAVEEGGSSYSDLNALLEEIASYRALNGHDET